MSKQWTIERENLKKDSSVGKYYDAEKFKDLYDQLDYVCKRFENQDIVKTLTRKIVEETTNIVEYNKSWNRIDVRTEINNQPTRFKCEIKYDGKEYFDPIKNNIGNVAGSRDRFKSYNRQVEIEANEVIIRINIEVE